MKRCPSCDRTFEDETLGFCPDDGTRLSVETSSPPVELMATMMAKPQSMGGSSYPPPTPPPGPDSGSFTPPPPNASWAPPSAPKSTPSPRSGGINKKLIFGGIGCLGLAVIVGIVGLVLLFVFSGPSSKMNPYKGDLKELVPETVGAYTRVDLDVLGESDKKNFGKVNEALGVAYKDSSDIRLQMFVGNYSSSKDAEEGLKSFKDDIVTKGWAVTDTGKKKQGWRTVGVRYILAKDISSGKADEKVLPDGAVIVQAQSSSPVENQQPKFVGWTNGSVVYVVAADGNKAVDFEKVFDASQK